jgi:hypothetical protein
MLYRETDIEALVEKIATLVSRLDDSALRTEQAKPMIYEVVSLFEQLIQLRAELKRAKAPAVRGGGHAVPLMKTASR